MDGTTCKTDNNSSTPCNNAEKKTPSTKITNEILTEEELQKATDNNEERTTAVNFEFTPAKYSNQVMDAEDAFKQPSKLVDAMKCREELISKKLYDFFSFQNLISLLWLWAILPYLDQLETRSEVATKFSSATNTDKTLKENNFHFMALFGMRQMLNTVNALCMNQVNMNCFTHIGYTYFQRKVCRANFGANFRS